MQERKYFKILDGSQSHGFNLDSSDEDYTYLFVPTIYDLINPNHKQSYEVETDNGKITYRDIRSVIKNLPKMDINDIQILYQLRDYPELNWLYENKENIILDTKRNILNKLLGYANSLLKRFEKTEEYELKVKHYIRQEHLYKSAYNIINNKLDTFKFTELSEERKELLENKVELSTLNSLFMLTNKEIHALVNSSCFEDSKVDWITLALEQLESIIITNNTITK